MNMRCRKFYQVNIIENVNRTYFFQFPEDSGQLKNPLWCMNEFYRHIYENHPFRYFIVNKTVQKRNIIEIAIHITKM